MCRKILILFLLIFLGGVSFAAFNLSGSTNANAFCEILEKTGSPVYTTAGGGITNAQSYTGSGATSLTFTADGIGNISYLYGKNEETPKDDGSGPIGEKTLLVRVWTGAAAGDGQYAYSQEFELGASMDGIRPITLTFSNWYTQGAPPEPGVSVAQTGYDMSANPKVTATLATASLSGYEVVDILGGMYNYSVEENGIGLFVNDNNSTSINLEDHASLTAGNIYGVEVFARNGFGNGTPGAGEVTTVAISGAAAEQTYTLSLQSKVPDATPGSGINAFSMPFASPWYVGSSQIRNAYELVVAINTAFGSNIVSTFGQWNASDQVLEGVMIAYNSDTLNDIDATDLSELQAITLAQGVGYQVYVTQDVNLVISNQAP